jgi:hypothetical protein
MNARLSSAAKTQHNWKKTLREYEIIEHQFSQFPHQRSPKKSNFFFPLLVSYKFGEEFVK